MEEAGPVKCEVRNAKCGMVLALMLCSAALGQSVSLAWNPSPDAAGYHVYCGGRSGTYTNVLQTDTTAITVSNLVAGATYYFAATCYDSNDMESDYSNEVAYTVPAPQLTNSSLVVLAPVEFVGSSNLLDWWLVGTGSVSLEVSATNPAAFFRARMLPLTIERKP